MMHSLLTVAEAANRIGFSVATIRRWLASGRLESVRFGRSVRIPEAVVEHLVRTGRT